eukprot:m.297984 g.297984  ORF g.297984 m.297984 type:complete len:55 (-) comp20090_c0_seq2:90-254(-)
MRWTRLILNLISVYSRIRLFVNFFVTADGLQSLCLVCEKEDFVPLCCLSGVPIV